MRLCRRSFQGKGVLNSSRETGVYLDGSGNKGGEQSGSFLPVLQSELRACALPLRELSKDTRHYVVMERQGNYQFKCRFLLHNTEGIWARYYEGGRYKTMHITTQY